MTKNKKKQSKTTNILEKSRLLANSLTNQTAKIGNAWRIYLLIPNLIGYFRMLLIIIAFSICFKQPYWFLACYGLSQLLDALDGYAARYFRQSTKYGAMLDMVTDRASTSALLIALAKLYPAYTRVFMAIIVLDIVSHFAYIYSALIHGKTSHKLVSQRQNPLLRIYYTYKPILFVLCLGNEAFLLLLYARQFEPTLMLSLQWQTTLIPMLHYTFAFLFGCKQFLNVIQLIQAAHDIVQYDQAEWGQ